MKKGFICYLAQGEAEDAIAYDLKELAELLGNIDIEAAANAVQQRQPDLNYLLGQGKIREIKAQVEAEGFGAVIFNQELSPRQVKALEDMFEPAEVWDRTQVILEIFRRRAASREGKIQVELARLTYALPRLFGLGKSMSRLEGRLRARGPGESKLETSRRAVREQIYTLRRELKEVRADRALRRERRLKTGVATASLVGYTNAGKSTLLNALAPGGEPVLAEDMLFATLDPVSRRLRLPSGRLALLSDTVGLIRGMPEKLMEAFKATLEELETADLLLHVIDLASPYREEQVAAVEAILDELRLRGKPALRVYNKADLEPGFTAADGVTVSARSGLGLAQLLDKAEAMLFPDATATLLIPFGRLGELSALRASLAVLAEEYGPDGVRVTLAGKPSDLERLQSRLGVEAGPVPGGGQA